MAASSRPGTGTELAASHAAKYLLSNLAQGTDSLVCLGSLSRLLPWEAPQRVAQYPSSDAFFPPCLRRSVPAKDSNCLCRLCCFPSPDSSSFHSEPCLEKLVSLIPSFSSPFSLKFLLNFLFHSTALSSTTVTLNP